MQKPAIRAIRAANACAVHEPGCSYWRPLCAQMVLAPPIRAACTVVSFLPFLRAALFELSRSRLTVPVLDASAIGISFVKRDFDTASQTMFLLNVGELLEDYTRTMSENELINSLLDVPDKAQKSDW